MKNKTLNLSLIAICLLTNTTIFAQTPSLPKPFFAKWELVDYEVSGKVKQIEMSSTAKQEDVIYIQFNEKGQMTHHSTSQAHRPSNSFLIPQETSNIFDDKGRIVEQTFAGNARVVASKITYTYSNDGREAIITYFDKEDNSKQTGRAKYYYESSGRLDQTCSYFDDKLEQIASFNAYDYDDKGNLISIGDYRCHPQASCDGIGGQTYKYDANNRIISESFVWTGHDFGTTTYEYNKQGQLIAIKKVAEKKTIEEQLFEYNSKGLISKKTVKTDNATTTFAYTHDANGNWTTCEKQTGDKKETIQRKISYY